MWTNSLSGALQITHLGDTLILTPDIEEQLYVVLHKRHMERLFEQVGIGDE